LATLNIPHFVGVGQYSEEQKEEEKEYIIFFNILNFVDKVGIVFPLLNFKLPH